MQKQLISAQIAENEMAIKNAFSMCDDLKMRKISCGKNKNRTAFLCYIEVNTGNNLINVLGRMLAFLDTIPDEQIAEIIKGNVFALSDAPAYQYMEEAIRGILVGDTVLFVDGATDFPLWLSGKESILTANEGDGDSIAGSGRSPGEGNGNPVQYSCWEIPWAEEPGGQ